MSRSVRSAWVRNTLLVLGGAGVFVLGWQSLESILRADPFSKFGLTGKPVGAEVGITMTDYEMKAYENFKLAAEAKVDKVEVRRDRSQMVMSGVREGKFYPADSEPFAFEMKNGTYFYFQNRLAAEKGSHVSNKDMDLTSDKFLYEEANKTLVVRGQVQGKLAGGAVKADDLTLNTGTRALSARNVMWVGEIAEMSQNGQRKQWTITGNLQLSEDGKTATYTPGRATDGEVIVAADVVTYQKDTDVLIGKGNVKYFGIDANMLCDEATVYRKERRAIFTGVVRMVVKSEDDEKVAEGEFPTIARVTPESLQTNPQGAAEQQVEVLRDTDNVRKYPIKVIADKVEYWYKKGERRAVITGSPFARQDLTEGWRLGWATEAFYDGEKETMTLKNSGGDKKDVKVFFSIGDQYVAQQLTFSTKEGNKSMSGQKVEASLFIDDEEVPTRTGGGTTGGTTGGR
jgi:lipopolysaccharide export system protein LptA